ncbi:MAG: undecaprenyl-diphosphate phosphatase [Acetivibrionales bacterium]|jgi:undecaprenyl-diphosphatase|nr:undecaprenyl-diphosphate phosphatase [Bacillota bacterium]NLP07562.1 undecaprenyl-diphosphate phosphatase [Clostridiaceae bacterium]HOA55026.1 undecaprenyl-diphosphate phosphatase [Clostridiales bacterium]HQD30487.1 undecaprenyl-diphosphate phosphatase [Clostridiales bacterium]
MSLLEAIIYGILQGLGEFLPISSTAHITLAPWFFGWKDPGLAFDIALHLGTLAAVIIFFWKDWINLIRAGLTDVKSPEGKLFWYIVLACVPGGVLGLIFEEHVETTFRNPLLIGIMLAVMGIVIYVADRFSRSEVELMDIGPKRSFLIGVSQALAMIPGVSRSGITMAAGRAMKIKREDAARFTFLLSTPFIFLSGVYKAKDLISVPVDAFPFMVAILTSAVVGLFSIKFLLEYLRRKGFGIFAVYRLVLGAIVIATALLR